MKAIFLSPGFRLAIVTFLLNLAGVAHAGSFSGRATWYNDGLGACGGGFGGNDYIVALPPIEYASGSKCWRNVRVSYQGKSVTAKVIDVCPSCGFTGIDLSKAAFQALAPLSQGLIQVTWEYV